MAQKCTLSYASEECTQTYPDNHMPGSSNDVFVLLVSESTAWFCKAGDGLDANVTENQS